MGKNTTLDEITRDNAKTLLMLLMNACGFETEDEAQTIDLIAYNTKKEIESQTKGLREKLEVMTVNYNTKVGLLSIKNDEISDLRKEVKRMEGELKNMTNISGDSILDQVKITQLQNDKEEMLKIINSPCPDCGCG